MKSRILVAAFMAAALALPAPALGADQDVDVQVLPANALGISVQEGLGFAIVIGESATQPFGMGITNTTGGGWIVTVDGPDLQSYTWGQCDETGCYDRILTGNTIPKSNVVVTGGDASWSEDDAATDSTITPYSVALGDNPVTIMEGTADAWGMFGFGPPHDPTVQVTIPAGSAYDQYYTTLTYTIMAP
jgi:hypothetical protein